MKRDEFSIIIGGEAGDGVSRSGLTLAKSFTRAGYHVFGANDYQSTIRGGHNFYMLKVRRDEVYSEGNDVDLMIAFDDQTISLHENELSSASIIIRDNSSVKANPRRADVRLCSVPLNKIIEELKGRPIMRNTVALGSVMALLNADLSLLEGVLRDSFSGQVAELNVLAAQRGYGHLKENYRFETEFKSEDLASGKKSVVEGNEAIGLRAISAGCKFFAAYPMTPTTGPLHFMAEQERSNDMIMFHAEGEIAAINMIVGAAFTGIRAMTATSGGGFSLMTEGLGMADRGVQEAAHD